MSLMLSETLLFFCTGDKGWSGRRESNPHQRLGKPSHYHYATPAPVLFTGLHTLSRDEKVPLHWREQKTRALVREGTRFVLFGWRSNRFLHCGQRSLTIRVAPSWMRWSRACSELDRTFKFSGRLSCFLLLM